ncbi:MAG TPA: YqgE/AlgH family protein [Acidimicrobiales bacterium]|nr:YqgE/AlgH family protein [Acidimicrobiales bacterium]HMS88958.1 YqgE/AlgH family protein [Acidimicrobiales bacterium]HRA34863.1 YqgE/AlgH family protein [Acidimicrobiales bacterium]
MSFTGRLLVATPLIGDPHFERSVVLLLTHNDDGAFGLVLNRPTETPVADVVPDWAPHVTSPGRIFMGGPVAPDALVAIGRPAGGPTDLAAGEGDGFSPLVGGLASVDLGRPPTGEAVPWSELRLFAGSAGWAVGQLEDELREGAWWLVPAEPNEVLTDDPAGLWRRVLRRQPGATGWFANCPLDPSAN